MTIQGTKSLETRSEQSSEVVEVSDKASKEVRKILERLRD